MQLKTKVFLAEISLVNSCDQGITKLKRKCLFGRKSILLFKSDTTERSKDMIYLVPPVTLKETKLVKIISQWYPSTHNLSPDFLCRNFTIDVICTSWKP